MKETMVGKVLIGITAALFVGVFTMACSSDLPISGPGPADIHGQAGNGGKGAAAGSADTGGGGAPLIVIDTSHIGGQSGTGGTTGNMACGSAAICTSTSCGNIVDDCGAVIDCGYANCDVTLCNTMTNECSPCQRLTADDCSIIGKNCGPVSDTCGGTIDCGTCTAPECCGCGGEASVCGGANAGLGNSGLKVTCIAGHQGCLCDDRGACGPNLTCTPQTAPLPSLCCNGTDCSGSSTSLGGTCTGNRTATCVPGVTVPTAAGTLDTCGYDAASFNESTILCGVYATGGGKDPAQIQAFFNDERSLNLGCTTTDNPVTEMPANLTTASAYYPQVGDPNCVDTPGRPMRPTLFITDITYDPNCQTGDWQNGGTAYDPIAVFGTWKSSNGTTPNGDPYAKNYWTLGDGSDPVPTAVSNQCPCSDAKNCPGKGHTSKGYGTEVKYEAGLISGHSYRLQIMAHDGDQTQNADSAEACVIFCAGTGTCTPLTCADFPSTVCGPQPDGCGGMTPECRKCCTPLTCADFPMTFKGPQDDGCGGLTEYCNFDK